MTFVDIGNDGEEFYVVAEQIAAVKAIGNGKCSVFLCGQSALEGFVVERNALELLEEICNACSEPDEDEDVEE